MITFTKNNSHGQWYAECSETGADYRIPTTKVKDFLAEIGMTEDFLAALGMTVEQVLAVPQACTWDMKAALAKYNG